MLHFIPAGLKQESFTRWISTLSVFYLRDWSFDSFKTTSQVTNIYKPYCFGPLEVPLNPLIYWSAETLDEDIRHSGILGTVESPYTWREIDDVDNYASALIMEQIFVLFLLLR